MAAILVVEPHPQVSELILRILERANHAGVCVSDSSEGDKLYRSRHFDLVMGDGPNTIKWLEQLHADGQAVLVITDTVTTGLPTLIKPFRMESLIDSVAELLKSAQD